MAAVAPAGSGATPTERRTLAGLFITSLLLGFSGALMPGPVFAAVVAGSASAGFWYGPAVVFGHGVLELLTVLALARGAGSFLSRPSVTRAIAAAGGVTLLWLGISMVLDGLAQRVVIDLSGAAPVDATPVVLGVVLSATNPYWVLWWATAGATYVALSLRSGAAGLGAFFTGHILSDLLWYAFIAAIVSGGTRLLGPAIQGPYNVLVAVAGGFLVFMALYFLRTAIRGR